jgi:hypothetical protein
MPKQIGYFVFIATSVSSSKIFIVVRSFLNRIINVTCKQVKSSTVKKVLFPSILRSLVPFVNQKIKIIIVLDDYICSVHSRGHNKCEKAFIYLLEHY